MQPVSFRVEGGEGGMALIEFLARKLGSSKNRAKDLLNARNVFVNRRRVWMARHELNAGDVVQITEAVPERKAPPRFDVLYEDDDYLVVNKRSGMLSNDFDSVESWLREQLGIPELAAAHRLDRDTSGCLLLAKNAKAFKAVVELFRAQEVKKVYHVVAAGRVEPREQEITIPINGEKAVTKIRTLDSNSRATHLQARIDTGRTHQIRKHLSAIRHPVIGDRFYGTRLPVTDESLKIGRQMLHASTLEFVHPATRRRVYAKAPLPRDFRNCLKMYGLT